MKDTLGSADLVFNNAGVQLISAIDELKVDDWQRQIDLNGSLHILLVAAAGDPETPDAPAVVGDRVAAAHGHHTRVAGQLARFAGWQLLRRLLVRVDGKKLRVLGPAGGFVVAGAAPGPGPEVLGRGEPGHVPARLGVLLPPAGKPYAVPAGGPG